MYAEKECRCCGTLMKFRPGEGSRPCPGCETQNQPPRVEGPALASFRHAIRLQKDMDFDRARASYDLVLNFYPENAEALWGRLLCQYGAAPISEGGRNYYMIHRPEERKPLREQPDYHRACQLAEPAFRAQMQQEAAYIDSAAFRIRKLAEEKPDFDVFLCHKCSRPEGGYTEDYKRACNLYMLLKAQGYRVFFAPVEMERQAAGEDYEAMIYHALRSSRVMLVVCSDAAYLHSKWVQAEWKRYLYMMERDPEKRLIPLLYGGMDVSGVPEQFRNWNLQGIKMEGDGYELVLRNLKRIFGEMKPEPGQEPAHTAEHVLRKAPDVPDGNDAKERTPPQPEPRRGIGRRILGIMTALGLLALCMYLLLKPGTDCLHSSRSWVLTDLTYEKRDSAYHAVTEVRAEVCDECGKVLQKTKNQASLEPHVFAGGACERCGARTTPTPGPTDCPHTGYSVSWRNWSYANNGESLHSMWREGDKYCSLCGAWCGTTSESGTEAHAYYGGACSKCGARATPTPKPRSTAVWEVQWDGTGVSSHVVNNSNVGGLNEGVYPSSWTNGVRFRAGEVVCFRGNLCGNGSQSSVKLGWRIHRVNNQGGVNDSVAGEQPQKHQSLDSTFIVWFKGAAKGEYYLEVFYFTKEGTQVIGRYDFTLY